MSVDDNHSCPSKLGSQEWIRLKLRIICPVTQPFTRLQLIGLLLSCPSNQAKKTKPTHGKQQQT